MNVDLLLERLNNAQLLSDRKRAVEEILVRGRELRCVRNLCAHAARHCCREAGACGAGTARDRRARDWNPAGSTARRAAG